MAVNPTTVDHVGFTVSDLDRSIEWYTQVLGLVLGAQADGSGDVVAELLEVPDVSLKAAFLTVGGQRLELTQFLQPAGKPYTQSNNEAGATHACFLVEDLDATYERMVELGVSTNAPPIYQEQGDLKGYGVLYFRDPDGIQMELFQRPPDAD
jgi:catechol 2,3-dioxygenase-like lactoylglutathione lyase family enzyme